MSSQDFIQKCSQAGYIADEALSTTLALMQKLGRPLLVEGEAGVGKTAIAKTLAAVFDTRLVRLQCYEGLDANTAVYEWNYSHQLLWIKMHEHAPNEARDTDIFDRRFLLARPLLQAIQCEHSPVLLIDEVDRADEAFEAFLLELLSDYQITIPELGTISAKSIPYVVLTSNGTRELSDALRRRCLYHYLDYPGAEKELEIINLHLPAIDQQFARQVVRFVQMIRNLELRKRPGVAETIDWARALLGLGIDDLSDGSDALRGTLSCLVKTRDDTILISDEVMRDLLNAES